MCLGEGSLSSVCEGLPSACSESYGENAPQICGRATTKLKEEVANAVGDCFVEILNANQCAQEDVEGCIEDALFDACEDPDAATACATLEESCTTLEIQNCQTYLNGMLPAQRSTVLSCVTEGAGCPLHSCAVGTL